MAIVHTADGRNIDVRDLISIDYTGIHRRSWVGSVDLRKASELEKILTGTVESKVVLSLEGLEVQGNIKVNKFDIDSLQYFLDVRARCVKVIECDFKDVPPTMRFRDREFCFMAPGTAFDFPKDFQYEKLIRRWVPVYRCEPAKSKKLMKPLGLINLEFCINQVGVWVEEYRPLYVTTDVTTARFYYYSASKLESVALLSDNFLTEQYLDSDAKKYLSKRKPEHLLIEDRVSSASERTIRLDGFRNALRNIRSSMDDFLGIYHWSNYFYYAAIALFTLLGFRECYSYYSNRSKSFVANKQTQNVVSPEKKETKKPDDKDHDVYKTLPRNWRFLGHAKATEGVFGNFAYVPRKGEGIITVVSKFNRWDRENCDLYEEAGKNDLFYGKNKPVRTLYRDVPVKLRTRLRSSKK